VFSGIEGRLIDRSRWRKRGWIVATQRARVPPREGDVQKACRRPFITSSLVCGRNPKQVFGEVGHASIRMMTDVYDSFIDPAHWAGRSEGHEAHCSLRMAVRGHPQGSRWAPEAPIFTERKTSPS
jgi:hypothetical protein